MTTQSTLDLGVIGNCQVAALIDRLGRYVWACMPRLDGDPVFCSLVRGDGDEEPHGIFSVELQGQVTSEQIYENNTAILVTVLRNDAGAAIRIIDFCPRFRQYDRNFRPSMMIRIVEHVAGHAVIKAKLRPLENYGAAPPRRLLGSNHVRFDGHSPWRVSTDMSLNALIEERAQVVQAPITFIMGADETVSENLGILARRFLVETRTYWRDWSRGLAVPFEWQAAVIRSAITLKMCSFEDSGSVLAALTTSIPEAANSSRNWDYRFCWLRDSYFTIHALNRLGATRTMEGYLRYINNVFAAAGDAPLQPVYGISGESQLTETTVSALKGYRGMGPVRVGNQAYEQVQHDVYGAIILAAMQMFFDERLHMPAAAFEFAQLERAGERCFLLYDQPDAGIWEYRGRARVHTFSSVMCWAGVDRLARIARHLGLKQREQLWRERAAEMHARILAATWSEQLQCFTEGWHVTSLDASVLLLADLDFVATDDPKFIATVRHLGTHLRRGQYLLRYNANDDFGAPENAFNICTFWYINALAVIGDKAEARQLFENMLMRRNHLGILSEDLNPVTGELWGNFPQTYSMVGVINSAMRLSCSWEEAM